MTKSERQQVFDKYGGKCAYCGCNLTEGWHVDHLEPIKRRWKTIAAHYRNKTTKEVWTSADITPSFYENFEWVPAKKVANGCDNPEMECMSNYMPACASCNINKHSMTLEQFRSLISGFIVSLNRDSTQYKVAKRYKLVREWVKPIVFYFENPVPLP